MKNMRFKKPIEQDIEIFKRFIESNKELSTGNNKQYYNKLYKHIHRLYCRVCVNEELPNESVCMDFLSEALPKANKEPKEFHMLGWIVYTIVGLPDKQLYFTDEIIKNANYRFFNPNSNQASEWYDYLPNQDLIN